MKPILVPVDDDGRLLCPACGSRLYVAVEIYYGGIPATVSPDDEEANCFLGSIGLALRHGDAEYSESELKPIYCAHCSLVIRPGVHEIKLEEVKDG